MYVLENYFGKCSFILYFTRYFYSLIDSLQGTPAVLSVSILIPCLSAEQLLVTVDTHTGMIQCHIPQHNRGPPSINELQNAFNTDRSRIPVLISEIR